MGNTFSHRALPIVRIAAWKAVPTSTGTEIYQMMSYHTSNRLKIIDYAEGLNSITSVGEESVKNYVH